MCHYWRRLLFGAPGSHQFATAVWTLSLNHKLLQKKRLFTRWLKDQSLGRIVRASSTVSREASQ